MYRGHTFLEVARHVAIYGATSPDTYYIQINKHLQFISDKPSWCKLHLNRIKFDGLDLYTQSRFHDTLNKKYPSVEAYTRVLEKILLGDIEPKKAMPTFSLV